MKTRERNYLKNITRILAAKLQCCLEMDKLFNTVLFCFVNIILFKLEVQL